MTRAFTFWTMELKQGVTEEEFERFLKEELPEYVHFPGTTGGWFKGIRGEREGKYLSYLEIEDYEAFRERYFKSDGERTEEYIRHYDIHPKNRELMDKFLALSDGWGDVLTEYLDIEIDYWS